jgi:protein dithiol oxidoreductase (disulfide-forming)
MKNSKFSKFLFGAVLAATGVLSTLPALAEQPVLNKEYTLVNPPVPTETAAKVEVLEFFSYGCIHCYKLHPHAKKFAAGVPNDVVFKRVHITFDRPQMRPLAKLFYTLEATGDLARLDDEVFAAVHDKGVNLMTDKSVLEWVGGKGVDMKKFTDTYNSFGIASKVSRAEQLTKAYQVSGTPQIYVNGRFAVRNEGVQSYDDIFRITNGLIEMSRSNGTKTRGIRG